ncbi:hypothetical protein [Streptomyces sp. NPDC088794]|uniref:hypothetical protein n=1 Tax=Streptomyces sp. NPDC088794 TaxID=3365902 RepID=UPI0037FA5E70
MNVPEPVNLSHEQAASSGPSKPPHRSRRSRQPRLSAAGWTLRLLSEAAMYAAVRGGAGALGAAVVTGITWWITHHW